MRKQQVSRVRGRGRGKGRDRRRGAVSSAPIVNAEQPKVSVVIPFMNERRTIRRVIRQARAVHPSTEVIVVANGSSAEALDTVMRSGAKVLAYSEPLGHDVGRSIGARAAKGEVLLFIDADMVLQAGKLRPFVQAVISGSADVALNDYAGPTDTKKVHPVVLAKHALNALLGHEQLRGASLTAIPHALSRKALAVIGVDSLLVPPLAQAKAIGKGLKVRAVHTVQVGRLNPLRKGRERKFSLASIIVGDHLEALEWWARHTDERGGMEDLSRQRQMLGGYHG
ncbi:glycosyltransferase family 2 protein [Paenibacillus sp. SYP-B4298]|uniref:glycosyltransferase family 2 protein n=1 Tax=Paenibacillus sp. SYP-B4298 TaxID=2996034 RepID=UPI0022DD7B5C|nr:glycosyltransferase family 2 protein [Paenibacillus sp. SYP-B4298]